MAKLDNPAGRLHTLLVQFAEEARTNGGTIVGVWSAVHDVEDHDRALVRMAATAALVHEVEQALLRYGDDGALEQFDHHCGDWVGAVFFPPYNLGDVQAMQVLPKARVLSALAVTSSLLSGVASEGPIPSPERQADAYGDVMMALGAVEEDTELPPELARELADHLRRVQSALSTFRIGGPDAVQAALARLRVAVASAPAETKETSTWKKVATAGAAVWVIFSSGPTVQTALEAWGQIAQALPPGTP